MKVLVINCGSSSIKYKLYEMSNKSVLAAGGIEKIGLEGSFLKTKINGETKIIESACPTHTEGIKLMFDTLLNAEYGAIKSLDEISAAGHRIVAEEPDCYARNASGMEAVYGPRTAPQRGTLERLRGCSRHVAQLATGVRV